ncbi:hypothetical protein AYI68_g6068 [Smittium mucronatum]|uniref:Uncharacterized protein n=1 Tax=Smittium mucronatum TaxID=133383 RepID=A0A1R0GSI4_9FUNG|nr:hypothetical protein AYI68_g6068 [Smittium mucronatum]
MMCRWCYVPYTEAAMRRNLLQHRYYFIFFPNIEGSFDDFVWWYIFTAHDVRPGALGLDISWTGIRLV